MALKVDLFAGARKKAIAELRKRLAEKRKERSMLGDRPEGANQDKLSFYDRKRQEGELADEVGLDRKSRKKKAKAS